MADIPIPTACDAVGGELAAPVAPPPRAGRFAAMRERRRLRRAAVRHAGRGLPCLGAAVDDRTPETVALENAYLAEASRVLERAIVAAHPIRVRHRELREWITLGERLLGEATRTGSGAARRSPRGRMRGEEHLTDGAFADRLRREAEQQIRAATVEARNLRTLLTTRRVELLRAGEQLDAIVDRALVQEETVRRRATLALTEYIDELVRRHPRGEVLSGLAWPPSFAPPPDWAQDPARLRAVVRGRCTEDAVRGDTVGWEADHDE